MPLTLANVITLARILLVPVLVVLLTIEIPHGTIIAAVVFAIAALSDGVDGYFARSRNAVTSFGTLMDPVADKLLITAALISLVALDRLAAWVAMVIVAREMAVTAWRSVVAQSEGVAISASILGKIKTATQVVAIFALIAFNPHSVWVLALVYVAVGATVVSGLDYFVGAKRHMAKGRRG